MVKQRQKGVSSVLQDLKRNCFHSGDLHDLSFIECARFSSIQLCVLLKAIRTNSEVCSNQNFLFYSFPWRSKYNFLLVFLLWIASLPVDGFLLFKFYYMRAILLYKIVCIVERKDANCKKFTHLINCCKNCMQFLLFWDSKNWFK